MANQAAKKRVQQNARIMRNVGALVFASNAALVVFGALLPWLRGLPATEFASAGRVAAHAANSGAMLVAAWLLRTISRPTFGADGDASSSIVDAGADLCMAGALHQYYFDVVYVTAFVAVAVVTLSRWFWAVHLLTLGFALFKLWTGVLQPFFLERSSGKQQQHTSRGETRRQRREKEAQERHNARAAVGHH